MRQSTAQVNVKTVTFIQINTSFKLTLELKESKVMSNRSEHRSEHRREREEFGEGRIRTIDGQSSLWTTEGSRLLIKLLISCSLGLQFHGHSFSLSLSGADPHSQSVAHGIIHWRCTNDRRVHRKTSVCLLFPLLLAKRKVACPIHTD